MKRFIILLLLLCFVSDAFSQKKDVKFYGEYPLAKEGDKIYLCKETDKKRGTFDTIDSAIINKDCRFVFDIGGIQADRYQIRVSPDKLDIFIDGASDMYIVLDKVFAKSYIKSNAADSLIRRYEQTNMNIALSQIGLAFLNKKYMDQNKTMPDSILKPVANALELLNKQKDSICREALKKADFSLVYIVLNGGVDKYQNIELNEAYDKMVQYIKESRIGKDYKAFLERFNNLSVGGKVPDFIEKTLDDKDVRLYEFIKDKKLILIDFWASWCSPCRKENKNIVKFYKEYKEKGFDIISVSLDSNLDSWKEAISADGLIWTHVSDLGGWKEKTAQLFNVTAVPCTFLIDGNGVIIAKNLRGKMLRDKIETLCKIE